MIALRGRTVCVVGGRGAIGSALVKRLADAGARVTVADRDGDPAVDVLDPRAIAAAVENAGIVVHLAGLKHAAQSSDDPTAYIAVNVTGTAHVLEACRRAGVEAVIYASTAHVYGAPRSVPVDEDHPTRPLSIYAASKLAGEALIAGYSASFGMHAVIARLANVYGADRDPETIIGRAIGQALARQPIALRSHESVRDYVHVDDAAEALARLAAFALGAAGCHVVNVTNGRGVRAREIAEIAARIGSTSVVDPGPVRETVPELVLSNAKLGSLVGWVPAIDIGEGLTRLARSSS